MVKCSAHPYLEMGTSGESCSAVAGTESTRMMDVEEKKYLEGPLLAENLGLLAGHRVSTNLILGPLESSHRQLIDFGRSLLGPAEILLAEPRHGSSPLLARAEGSSVLLEVVLTAPGRDAETHPALIAALNVPVIDRAHPESPTLRAEEMGSCSVLSRWCRSASEHPDPLGQEAVRRALVLDWTDSDHPQL